jgi:spore germination protein GerM
MSLRGLDTESAQWAVRSAQGRAGLRTAHRALRTLLALCTLLTLAVLAGACKKKQSSAEILNAQNQVAPRVVRLYFESPSMLLAAEQRNVQVPQSSAGAMSAVLRELFKGATNPAYARTLPADTVLRGAYLLPDGTAFVDLGGQTLSQGWPAGSHEELMAVYAIVQTVTSNFPEAKKVRVLVNGTPAETLAGHIALDKPLVPMGSLVDPRAK